MNSSFITSRPGVDPGFLGMDVHMYKDVGTPSQYLVFSLYFDLHLFVCLDILQNQFLIISVAEYQTVHILLS